MRRFNTLILKKVTIAGFRGFEGPNELCFAIPNGRLGSGLTVITGANNSGKSAILECIKARHGYAEYNEGLRNKKTNEVYFRYDFESCYETISSVRRGDFRVKHEFFPPSSRQPNILVLPSRRYYGPNAGSGSVSREDYIGSLALRASRGSSIDFGTRLHSVSAQPEVFNSLMSRVLGYPVQWRIDVIQGLGPIVVYEKGDVFHSIEGLGEGVLSVYTIINAFYDSSPGEMICIDEPELALHPALQKRLMNTVMEYSKDRQVVIATHSSHFVDAQSVINGGTIVRVTGVKTASKLFQTKAASVTALKKLVGRQNADSVGNINGPHTFGNDAKEIFFQEDGVIITEGSDDVQLIPIAAAKLGLALNGSFYGWGVGGAGNIKHLCTILSDLGYTKVASILDSDKQTEAAQLQADFPAYLFKCLPSKDVRSKAARPAIPLVQGLLDESYEVREEFKSAGREALNAVSNYIGSGALS